MRAEIDPATVVFLDATSTHTSLIRAYGRAPRGERVVGPVPRNHGPDVSSLAAVTPTGIVAPLAIEGAVDSAVFVPWLRDWLLPPPPPGTTIVCDNLGVHTHGAVRPAVEAAGCRLAYLPPYSAGLNPIDLGFAKCKAHLRSVASRCHRCRARHDHGHRHRRVLLPLRLQTPQSRGAPIMQRALTTPGNRTQSQPPTHNYSPLSTRGRPARQAPASPGVEGLDRRECVPAERTGPVPRWRPRPAKTPVPVLAILGAPVDGAPKPRSRCDILRSKGGNSCHESRPSRRVTHRHHRRRCPRRRARC